MAAVEVKVLRKKASPEKPPDLKHRLAAELGALLPADAFAFALPDEGEGRGSPFDSRCSLRSQSASFRKLTSFANERLGVSARMAGSGAASGLPSIVIVHRGRALALELPQPGKPLSDAQRSIFPRLTAAGMRIEVARSFAEALRALSEMGLTLSSRESLTRQVAELFRDAKRGKA